MSVLFYVSLRLHRRWLCAAYAVDPIHALLLKQRFCVLNKQFSLGITLSPPFMCAGVTAYHYKDPLLGLLSSNKEIVDLALGVSTLYEPLPPA